MDGVPVIDLGEFEGGDAAVRRRIADEVAEAVETIGFLSVTGHGVAQDIIDRVRQGAWTFFGLPEAEKTACMHPSRNLNRGYTPFAEEHHASSNGYVAPADLREGYIFGPFGLSEEARSASPLAAHAYQPNIWPDAAPGATEAFQDYYRAVSRFNTVLTGVFALALGLPEGFFRDKFDAHASTVRLLHYPPQDAAPPEGQLRCGAHTDFGSHTILLADDAPGGLQVLNLSGNWVDVIPPPNAFIVNIGDMMKMWTNDRWRSTLHRVANPPVEAGRSGARLSIAYFTYPNPDAVIECIPTCVAAGDAPRHPPVLSGDYRRMKVSSMTVAAQETAREAGATA